MDSSYDPEKEWKVGQALDELRYVSVRRLCFFCLIPHERSEGILLLSGGLTIHNLRDRSSFHETHSADIYRQFDNAVTQAVQVPDVSGLRWFSPHDRLRLDLSMPSHLSFSGLASFCAFSPMSMLSAAGAEESNVRPCESQGIQCRTPEGRPFRSYLCCWRGWRRWRHKGACGNPWGTHCRLWVVIADSRCTDCIG